MIAPVQRHSRELSTSGGAGKIRESDHTAWQPTVWVSMVKMRD